MRRPKTAKPPSSRLVAFSGAAVALMHAVPIGIVQFADYASDLGVLYTFKTSSTTALQNAEQADPELFLNLTVDCPEQRYHFWYCTAYWVSCYTVLGREQGRGGGGAA